MEPRTLTLETHLPRHIDGANPNPSPSPSPDPDPNSNPNPDPDPNPNPTPGAAVDGSLVLGLPTYDRFTGGGLTVWDGEEEAEVTLG